MPDMRMRSTGLVHPLLQRPAHLRDRATGHPDHGLVSLVMACTLCRTRLAQLTRDLEAMDARGLVPAGERKGRQ